MTDKVAAGTMGKPFDWGRNKKSAGANRLLALPTLEILDLK